MTTPTRASERIFKAAQAAIHDETSLELIHCWRSDAIGFETDLSSDDEPRRIVIGTRADLSDPHTLTRLAAHGVGLADVLAALPYRQSPQAPAKG